MSNPYGHKHQRLRRLWQAELTRLGSLPCGCGCGKRIKAGEPFDLGHGVAVMHGGDGTDSRPEMPGHNRANGARLKNGRGAASEDWW